MKKIRYVVGIDPAIQITGYSVLDLTGGKESLKYCGIFDTKNLDTTDILRRTHFVVGRFSTLIRDLPRDEVLVCIEEPPRIIYKRKGGAGRATHIFPVFATAFSIAGFCHARTITCKTFLPRVWQAIYSLNASKIANIPVDSDLDDSKRFSLHSANEFLAATKMKRRLKSSGTDHNIADAINIARYGASRLKPEARVQ